MTSIDVVICTTEKENGVSILQTESAEEDIRASDGVIDESSGVIQRVPTGPPLTTSTPAVPAAQTISVPASVAQAPAHAQVAQTTTAQATVGQGQGQAPTTGAALGPTAISVTEPSPAPPPSLSTRRLRNFTRLFCCVTDDCVAESSKQQHHHHYYVSSWTERTRRRFEVNVESLLSSCDPILGLTSFHQSGSGSGSGGGVKHLFEVQYRKAIENGLVSLNTTTTTTTTPADHRQEDGSSPSSSRPSPRRSRSLFSLTNMRRRMSPSTRRVATVHKAHSLDEAVDTPSEKYKDNHSKSSLPNHFFPDDDIDDDDSDNDNKPEFQGISDVIQNGFNCECGYGTVMVADEHRKRRASSKSLFESDEDPAYDSDPEFFHGRRASMDHRLGVTSMESDVEESSVSKTRRHTSFKIDDDHDVSRLMEEMIHGTLTLIWHPHRGEIKNNAPICVKAWIELGCRLKGRVIQPKFVWRSAYHQDNNNGTTGSNKRVNHNNKSRQISSKSPGGPLYSVDLLDISRILSSQDIDRQKFPLAKKSTSFTLVTSDSKYHLFEVADRSKKDRVVSGLKLVVARLASMIIVGDKKVFDDFFYPTSNTGLTVRKGVLVGTLLAD